MRLADHAGQPSLAHPDAPRPPRPGVTPSVTSDFVGRADEFGVLDDAFDLVVGGRSLAVLIGGEAGIGKSRIVEEFCDRIRLAGAVVLTGMCVPADSALPYAPVLGILRDIGRQLGHPPRAAHLLHAMGSHPDLADPVGSPDPVSAPEAPAGPFAKTVFFESILSELIGLAEESPVLCVFEDLHWADSASSQLVDFLIRNLGDARVLTLGTYRDDEFAADHPLDGWLSELGRHARVRHLHIGPMTRAELSTLVANTFGERPSPRLLDSVWTRALGNPFFAEELLAQGDPASLPKSLHAVISGRVRSLTEQARSLLEVVAVGGAVVSHRLLETIAGLEPAALDTAIGDGIQRNILAIDDSGAGYQFRHALLREAVYAALLPARRGRLHRAIAGALTADPSLGSATPSHGIAELASHWWSAGEWGAALEPSVRAADAFLTALAFREAITFLERALLADERAPAATAAAGTTRALLLERAAEVAYLAGENTRAVELAHAAIRAVDHRGDPVAAARCRTLLGRNLWGVGDSAGAFEAYREAVALLPADEVSAPLARLLAEEARSYLLMSQYALGERRCREAITAARAVSARDVECHALTTLGSCRGGLGFYDEAIPLLDEARTIAEELAIPEALDRAYSNLTQLFVDCGRLADASSVMFDGAALGEELWGVRLHGATGNGVEALVRLGRYEEAQDVLSQLGSHALGVCAPAPWTLPSPIMIRRGRFADAERMIATARELTSGLGDVQHAANVLGLAGELELERGDPVRAAEYLEEGLSLASRSDDEVLQPELSMWAARALADQYDAMRAHGRSPDVQLLARRSDELVRTGYAIIEARENRQATTSPRVSAAVAQTVAERSRLDGAQPELWRAAAERWEAAHEPYPQAYCRWREAEALLESRAGRARALTSLDQAWRTSRELGAQPLTSRIVNLAQRGRLELSDATPVAPSSASVAARTLGLTAREVEVLGQLAAGRSDREIGEELFISKKTVSVHVSNVLRKLAVARRVEAGKIGQAHGLGV